MEPKLYKGYTTGGIGNLQTTRARLPKSGPIPVTGELIAVDGVCFEVATVDPYGTMEVKVTPKPGTVQSYSTGPVDPIRECDGADYQLEQDFRQR